MGSRESGLRLGKLTDKSGGADSTCWTYNKYNCNISKNKEPKNEQHIAENRWNFSDNKKKNHKTGGNNSNDAGNRGGTNGTCDYKRDKWSPPVRGLPADDGTPQLPIGD